MLGTWSTVSHSKIGYRISIPRSKFQVLMSTHHPTPALPHKFSTTFGDVYEPAEDSFLLMDALEKDAKFIQECRSSCKSSGTTSHNLHKGLMREWCLMGGANFGCILLWCYGGRASGLGTCWRHCGVYKVCAALFAYMFRLSSSSKNLTHCTH